MENGSRAKTEPDYSGRETVELTAAPPTRDQSLHKDLPALRFWAIVHKYLKRLPRDAAGVIHSGPGLVTLYAEEHAAWQAIRESRDYNLRTLELQGPEALFGFLEAVTAQGVSEVKLEGLSENPVLPIGVAFALAWKELAAEEVGSSV